MDRLKSKFLPGFVPFDTDPWQFDLDEYLDRAVPDPSYLKYPETRRELTRANPLLFSLLYMPHHLKNADNDITFSLMHLQMYRWAAAQWHQRAGLKDARDAFIAPRGSGKSSMVSLLLPMWAACHGFITFTAAYSDSESTIQNHINTFRNELKNNKLIQQDFPGMSLGRHQWTKEEIIDNGGEEIKDQALFFKTYGGFIFAAKSISSNSLGLKVGAKRPDFILLDDVERQGGDYSPHQAEKRRQAIVGGILGQSKPLGARVVLIGTNLMIGSMIDGMMKHCKGEEGPEWVIEENFRTSWWRPFIRRPDGTKQSMWPAVWSTEFLLAEEGKESFQVDFDSQPMATGGAFWEAKDFKYGTIPEEKVSFGILSIDPAVTSSRKSDYTAMSVVLYSRELNRYEVVYVNQYKITPAQLRAKVEDLLSSHPQITSVYVETTQGGLLWQELFKGIPVKVIEVKPSVSKEMRANRALNIYQTIQPDGLPRVLHRSKFADAEAQMKAFPRVGNDDLTDCITQAIGAIEERVRNDATRSGRKGPVMSRANRRR